MVERGTIVYVHGASDRATQVADHVGRIERQLALANLDFDVLASRWGETAGADLSRIELAHPESAAALIGALPAGPPLQTLEDLAAAAPVPARRRRRQVPAPERQADELLEICRTQVGAAGESIVLEDGSSMPLAAACRRAATTVGESPAYAAARAAAVPDAVLIDAVGRAVASTVAATAAAPAEVARAVEIRIAEAVLGAAVATILASYLGIDVGPDLKRWATDVLVPHRARLVRDAGLGPADVVLYLRSGDRIRSLVLETIAAAVERGGPVVALGNSMGGIILVEALAQAAAPRPDLLVTIGSQAPLLATFGALVPLGRPDAPPPFQPWLNIYDRRDLLGFVCGRVWPGEPGIVDVAVDLGVGFPDAHGATYLSSPEVFAAIARKLAGAGPGAAAPTRPPPPTASLLDRLLALVRALWRRIIGRPT